jgi:predicted transcriptional regulator
MAKTLTEMAAAIASAQAAHESMSIDEMESFLNRTFQTLQSIKGMEEGAALEPGKVETAELAMDPKKSIQRNKVICLECGKEFKQLIERHPQSHGMNMKEYRKAHGFSARQPLAAKSLVAKRRKVAKDQNLGERLKKAREARKKKVS